MNTPHFSSSFSKKSFTAYVRLAMAATTVSVASLTSHAAVVTYSSPAAFSAATNGDTTYSFAAPASGNAQPVSSPFTSGPLTFSSTFLSVVNDGSFGTGQTYLASTLGTTPAGTESISLSGNMALSFTLGSYYGTTSVSVSVNGVAAASFSTASGAPASTFFGLTSTTPITSLSFAYSTPSNNTATELDVLRFQVGNANAVPEPTTWALVGVGVVLGGFIVLRHRTSAS